MPAEIVRLSDYRRSTVRSLSGVLFPTLYRVQGFAPKPEMVGDAFQQTDSPDLTWPLQLYSITPEVNAPKIINQKSTTISRFEPGVDEGWLYVRAHADESSALEYCQGIDATLDEFEYQYVHRLFITEQGIFTLYHRRVPRTSSPDHLIIYTDQTNKAGPNDLFDWCHIVKSDGTVSNDYFLLIQ